MILNGDKEFPFVPTQAQSKLKKNLTVIPSLVLFRRLRETNRLAALDTDLIRFNLPGLLVYDFNSRQGHVLDPVQSCGVHKVV